MNLTQLNVFREVMESGSISQTAKKLGRTQPAISLSLKNLEQSLELKLFERRGHQLIPVPEARYLMAEATDILDRLSTVSGTMKSLKNAQSGSLNIAAMPGPSAYLFPRYISDAVGDNPEVRISLSSRSSQQIQELAGTQSIDFGFADFDPPANKPQQYKSDVICANCFCALHRDHPLAQKEAVSIEDLDNLPMGVLQSNHPIHYRTSDAFRLNGVRFNQMIDSQIFLPLLQFISVGQCLAIVDPLTATTEREMNTTASRVVFIPLMTPILYDYAILTPLHRPPSQLALRIKSGWIGSVMQMLDDIGASPQLIHSDL